MWRRLTVETLGIGVELPPSPRNETLAAVILEYRLQNVRLFIEADIPHSCMRCSEVTGCVGVDGNHKAVCYNGLREGDPGYEQDDTNTLGSRLFISRTEVVGATAAHPAQRGGTGFVSCGGARPDGTHSASGVAMSSTGVVCTVCEDGAVSVVSDMAKGEKTAQGALHVGRHQLTVDRQTAARDQLLRLFERVKTLQATIPGDAEAADVRSALVVPATQFLRQPHQL